MFRQPWQDGGAGVLTVPGRWGKGLHPQGEATESQEDSRCNGHGSQQSHGGQGGASPGKPHPDSMWLSLTPLCAQGQLSAQFGAPFA